MGGFFAALMRAAAVTFPLQWAGFAHAAVFKTEKFYDLFGGSNFVLIALLSFLSNGGAFHLRQLLATAAVTIWGLRLSTFLFQRIKQAGHDSRFDKVRGNPRVFFIYWTVQALWVLITSLPVLLINSKGASSEEGASDDSSKNQPAPAAAATAAAAAAGLTVTEMVGFAVWAFGFLFEAVSDAQKSSWRALPGNKDTFINVGLWKLSRHPNYFGEIVLWTGLWIASLSVGAGVERFLALLSPLFVGYLLTRVSGIPLLERKSDKLFGHLQVYQEYKRNTPVLVPRFF